MYSFFKRSIACFVSVLMLFLICGVRLYIVATDEKLSEAAVKQSTKRLDVSSLRGTIYDCNGIPLTNALQRQVTVLFPNEKGMLAAAELLKGEALEQALTSLRKGNPYIADGRVDGYDGGVQSLTVPIHYNGSLEHVIGYLDGSGHGVSGIEKGFDDILFSENGLSITYTTDSYGRMIGGLEWTVNKDSPCGSVTLTIDSKIQRIVETAMSNVGAGAAVVMDAKNGELKAVVSTPKFSQNDLSSALEGENSPFINRTLYSYNVGSVFKPLIAIAAIESGMDDYVYDCKGSITVDGIDFKCNKWAGHGVVDLKMAIEQSCNTYFYTLGLNLGAERIYDVMSRFRFDSSLNLGGGIVSSKGNLPALRGLTDSSAALINLSIGQGDLLISPIGICTLYASIINGGEYFLPSILKSKTENGIKNSFERLPSTEAMSKVTADILKGFLMSALQNGTGNGAFVEGISAGGKTGTAQTGWKTEDRSILNGWFCGFFEGKDTEYVIVVLKEDVKSGSYDCAPIFREITLKMHSLGY